MKKFSILIAAVAMMAMTACNEKPAKVTDQAAKPADSVQVDSANKKAPKIDVEHAKPTEDGKDHTVSEFNTKEYQVRLENLADGTYRVTMWKAGQDKSAKPEQVAESKKCVMSDGGYLMQTDDGKNYIITTKKGGETITIMDAKSIIYEGSAK